MLKWIWLSGGRKLLRRFRGLSRFSLPIGSRHSRGCSSEKRYHQQILHAAKPGPEKCDQFCQMEPNMRIFSDGWYPQLSRRYCR